MLRDTARSSELKAGFRALPKAPKDSGRLALIVRRRPDGERETPEYVQLFPDEGVPGDGWSRRPPRDPLAQLAVMRRDVAELIANGQPLTALRRQSLRRSRPLGQESSGGVHACA